MTMPGETILTGATVPCRDCGQDPLADIRSRLSADGMASIQTNCLCGPFSRESIYVGYDLGERAEKLATKAVKAAGDDMTLRIEAFRGVLQGLGIERKL